MNKSTNHPFSNILRLFLLAVFAITLTFSSGGQTARAASNPAPVDLGTAAPFAILTKTGISTTGATAITGNIGVSPVAATYITGFSLIMDSTNTFSRSSLVTGKVFAANYATPTPANMTTAIGDMQIAYADAAGRTLPDYTELYAGNLSGRTLTPGLYKWGTGVLINNQLTLSGPADAIWIFQISGNLIMGSGAEVILSGGAQARNIFWQVAGGVGVEMGTTSHMEGTILAAKAIHLRTGATLNGRALSQTAVTLDANRVVLPAVISGRAIFTSDPVQDGWILETGENTNVGGANDSKSVTFYVGDNIENRQFLSILQFSTDSLPDTAVITSAAVRIKSFGSLNPFNMFGDLLLDVRKPYFGSASSLQSADFQAQDHSSAVGTFSPVPINNWHQSNLNDAGKFYVNRTGLTQFRLRFAIDDNNNNIADYIKFYSGNAASENRARLVVTYDLP